MQLIDSWPEKHSIFISEDAARGLDFDPWPIQG